jgi:hypothetical protein
MSKPKIKVITICGWGRSGSTLLGCILDQIDGFFYGGELRNIWKMSVLNNRLCGCGVPFKECSLWKKIINDSFGNIDEAEIEKTIKSIHKLLKSRFIPIKFLPLGNEYFKNQLGFYMDIVKKLFESIITTTNSKIIVDSTKAILYSYLLSLMDDIELHVLHIIRDPRGVAFSRQKKKIQPDSEEVIYMHQSGILKSSMLWDIRNFATEFSWGKSLKSYTKIRYEDFVGKPKMTFTKILETVGESSSKLPFISDNEIELKKNHTVWGNPSRFKTGIVKLKLDEEWRTKMKPSDRLITTFLTFPLLLRYGYKV